jgi:lipid-binding SYLF domain-containing protein
MNNNNYLYKLIAVTAICVFSTTFVAAATALEIDARAKAQLESFLEIQPGAKEVLDESKATLVFPGVYKAGVFFLGGEYGEGVLFTQNADKIYYNIVSGSFGWQLGVQKKTIILMFMNDEVMDKFKNSSNWDLGADASVAVINTGASGAINIKTINKPILAFVFDQKGLMYNLTLEGTKITKIDKGT